jgi:hypothetical protein
MWKYASVELDVPRAVNILETGSVAKKLIHIGTDVGH